MAKFNKIILDMEHSLFSKAIVTNNTTYSDLSAYFPYFLNIFKKVLMAMFITSKFKEENNCIFLGLLLT